jgi:hypothetical protein
MCPDPITRQLASSYQQLDWWQMDNINHTRKVNEDESQTCFDVKMFINQQWLGSNLEKSCLPIHGDRVSCVLLN